ncbi:nuclear pore complex subunit Nup133, putative [Talaromyces stipitatus ATCC 10500]|uniref:Nuclear pore complex subunit Nup133, putative n=1 Tax=Talaromyces stipitatus (strain ATCC 10500 / CBS 375.48 / QM 6759 / NRRL 1006) TaxID=441959 RepID=B8LTN6_TALSN|nr:nuclear pore complex subunit Nup133, putative [Talaromyces stipitatus ATCC 10500]EED23628.1 nuclear pore complex subunit Nup133, putative [Talaromyces stipitatus ATCC 10500]
MFAPGSGGQDASSLRTSRRRQRTSLEDSAKPPAAKRQRSTLRQEYRPSVNKAVKPDEEREIKPGATIQSHRLETGSQQERVLPIRGSEKTSKAVSQTDHTVVLCSNEYYTITQLASGSDQPGETTTGPARCIFNSESGFALLLSESRALIWPYLTNVSLQGDGGLLSVAMPEWCTSDGEALMGTLILNTTCTVPGLFIVVPATGKMVYWETASNATFMGIAKQKQSGLQGSISGLFFGEKVTDVTNAEPSGVITTFSSGRVAQITFRDPQGKPALSVNFLQSTAKLGAGGLFFGIRSVLGSSGWRKDTAAVRAGNSLFRGQRDVLVLSTSGLLEIWDSHWNGVNKVRAEIDLQKEICSYLGLGVNGKVESSLKVHDFVASFREIKPTSNSNDGHKETTLFVLIDLSYNTAKKNLAVIKAQLYNDNMKILSSNMLEHMISNHDFEKQKPRLHVTDSWDTAFILIGQKLWIMSLQEIETTPSVQLLNGVIPKPFQDRIQFQEGDKYEILGMGSEEASSETQHSDCILMIRGFGLIRISATSSGSDTTEYVRVTAKQKLEQAVFFGTMPNTPLSFSSDGEPAFTVQEFEEAALQICSDILRSTSQYIPGGGIALDQTLRRRSKALSDLTTELIRRRIPLSKNVRWELIWAGEKLAAQRSMWKLEEDFRDRWDSETFLSRVISSMSNKFKTEYVPSDSNKQNDHVRQWFDCDTFQMQHIIPWIFNAIRGMKGPSGRAGPEFLSQVYQASELTLAVLETAYQFREDHARQFGFEEEDFEKGVLQGSYSEIPEFWTSENMVYNETLHMLDLELESPKWIHQSASKMFVEDRDMLASIGKNSCRRLRVLNMMLTERVHWLYSQSDPKSMDEANALKELSLKQRKWQLYKMGGIGQLQGAIELAEEFRDLEALVELMVELQYLVRDKSGSVEGTVTTNSSTVRDEAGYKKKIAGYFEYFGEPFADAFFSRYINIHQPGALLTMKDFQSSLTKFLRKNPSYAPLSWVNDIIGEEDYETASSALEKLAFTRDDNLWDQRVQLSLSKITRLASLEGNSVRNDRALHKLRELDDRLEMGTLQERVYEYVLPALHSAIDEKAEVELALEQFGGRIINQPAFKDLVEELLQRLIRRQSLDADQLINLLTLIDEVHFLEGDDNVVCGHEFYIAIRVLRLSGYALSDPTRYDFLHKLIWRRCFLRDDWNSIAKTEFRSDGRNKSLFLDTTLARTLLDCIREENHWGKSRGELYLIPDPSDTLSLGSLELIKSRFRSGQWPHIERDLRTEVGLLERLLENTKLKEWFSGLMLLAEEVVAETNDLEAGQMVVPGSLKARFNWVS